MTTDEIRKLERTLEECGMDVDAIIEIVETALEEINLSDNPR